MGFVICDAAGDPLPSPGGKPPKVYGSLRAAKSMATLRRGRVLPAWVEADDGLD